jgi:hypothetical protein
LMLRPRISRCDGELAMDFTVFLDHAILSFKLGSDRE